MLQGIDINQVRQYNASLKQYRDKAASINAQIEYTKNELNTLCTELSKELGMEVNESNVEAIYNEQVEKINSTLKSGNAVLSKIASEEIRLQQESVMNNTQQVSQVDQQTVQQSHITPTAPIAPNFLADTGANGILSGTSAPGTVFSNAQNVNDLPMGAKMFKLGG